MLLKVTLPQQTETEVGTEMEMEQTMALDLAPGNCFLEFRLHILPPNPVDQKNNKF